MLNRTYLTCRMAQSHRDAMSGLTPIHCRHIAPLTRTASHNYNWSENGISLEPAFIEEML